MRQKFGWNTRVVGEEGESKSKCCRLRHLSDKIARCLGCAGQLKPGARNRGLDRGKVGAADSGLLSPREETFTLGIASRNYDLCSFLWILRSALPNYLCAFASGLSM